MAEIIIGKRVLYTLLLDDEDVHLIEDGYLASDKRAEDRIYARLYPRPVPTKGGRIFHYVHRLIMPDADMVDHINGNGLDNRRSNLRPCSYGENNRNAAPRKNKRVSQYIGVFPTTNGKWYGQVSVDYVTHNTPRFPTEYEAAVARDALARKLHGEFAVINIT